MVMEEQAAQSSICRLMSLGVLSSLACADEGLFLQFPPPTVGAASELVYLDCPGRAPRVVAREASTASSLVRDAGCVADGRVYVLRFTETLDELELETKELPGTPCDSGSFDVEGCCLLRGLPTAAEAFEAALDDDAPSFSLASNAPPAVGAFRYRRRGLRFNVRGAERHTSVSASRVLLWEGGRFLLIEESSGAGRLSIREFGLEDARAGRTSSAPLRGEIDRFSRLSDAVAFDDGELLIASFSVSSRRGPPDGPFTEITHEGAAVSELLLAPDRVPRRVYGLSQYEGRVSLLEGDAWRLLGPEVPETPPCRHPAGRSGQEGAALWLDGAGYLVPPSGDAHAVVYPSGMWRVQDDIVRWLDWPESQHCASALGDVRGALWVGTRNGILFERKNNEFSRLDAPSAEGSVNHILELTDELTLILGDNGLLGVTDGQRFCAVPPQLTGVEADYTGVYRVGDELLVTSSEADHVKNVLVLGL